MIIYCFGFSEANWKEQRVGHYRTSYQRLISTSFLGHSGHHPTTSLLQLQLYTEDALLVFMHAGEMFQLCQFGIITPIMEGRRHVNNHGPFPSLRLYDPSFPPSGTHFNA